MAWSYSEKQHKHWSPARQTFLTMFFLAFSSDISSIQSSSVQSLSSLKEHITWFNYLTWARDLMQELFVWNTGVLGSIPGADKQQNRRKQPQMRQHWIHSWSRNLQDWPHGAFFTCKWECWRGKYQLHVNKSPVIDLKLGLWKGTSFCPNSATSLPVLLTSGTKLWAQLATNRVHTRRKLVIISVPDVDKSFS